MRVIREIPDESGLDYDDRRQGESDCRPVGRWFLYQALFCACCWACILYACGVGR